jgi:hypothetical protein
MVESYVWIGIWVSIRRDKWEVTEVVDQEEVDPEEDMVVVVEEEDADIVHMVVAEEVEVEAQEVQEDTPEVLQEEDTPEVLEDMIEDHVISLQEVDHHVDLHVLQVQEEDPHVEEDILQNTEEVQETREDILDLHHQEEDPHQRIIRATLIRITPNPLYLLFFSSLIFIQQVQSVY